MLGAKGEFSAVMVQNYNVTIVKLVQRMSSYKSSKL